MDRGKGDTYGSIESDKEADHRIDRAIDKDSAAQPAKEPAGGGLEARRDSKSEHISQGSENKIKSGKSDRRQVQRRRHPGDGTGFKRSGSGPEAMSERERLFFAGSVKGADNGEQREEAEKEAIDTMMARNKPR